jgi:tetratricopeptide (TPR) repeat protein
VRSALSPAKRRAFERYGGFGKRRQGDDSSGILTRRYGLIAGSSLNAPVYRAISKGGGLVDVRSSLGRTPFLNADVGDVEAEAPTLDDLLDRGDAAAQHRAEGEAWALFLEGQYRQATRAFESAITLEPSDFESRIGEVFGYLSVGATRTALALLGELVRRDVNPFQHDLHMAERYGNVADVNQLRIQGRRSAGAADPSADANALYIFVLWYLGEYEEAFRAAESLAKRAPAKAYASWPEKMRAARSTESSEE